MSRNLVRLSVAASFMAGAALAEVPRVAADIAPVHSLVAQVMDGVGEPALIVAPGASPHEYNLRPSEAAALQEADLVFWIGPDLTPWLDDALATLAGDATVVELLDTEGAIELPIRHGSLFEAHSHDAQGKEGAQNASPADEHHDGAAQGAQDPHAWLSPDNGAAWLDTIAAALSAADPQNAATYRANAAKARARLDALATEIAGMLDPVRARNFIVFHDAYQYFEAAFDFPASGAISLSDATDPSPARIAGIQARIADLGVSCILSEPQFAPGLVAAVMGGSTARTGVLDPLGSGHEPGPELYGAVLRDLAGVLAECL